MWLLLINMDTNVQLIFPPSPSFSGTGLRMDAVKWRTGHEGWEGGLAITCNSNRKKSKRSSWKGHVCHDANEKMKTQINITVAV